MMWKTLNEDYAASYDIKREVAVVLQPMKKPMEYAMNAVGTISNKLSVYCETFNLETENILIKTFHRGIH